MVGSFNKYLDHSYNIENKRHASLSSITKKCKNCGHSIQFVDLDRIICSHCGLWVYKNDKLEFQYKMKEKIKKEKQYGTKKNV